MAEKFVPPPLHLLSITKRFLFCVAVGGVARTDDGVIVVGGGGITNVDVDDDDEGDDDPAAESLALTKLMICLYLA